MKEGRLKWIKYKVIRICGNQNVENMSRGEGGQLSGHLVGTEMPQTHFDLLINEPVHLIEHVLHMELMIKQVLDEIRLSLMLKNFYWATR